MGVYIRGMDMPETCKLCYLSEFDPGFYAYVCKPIGMRIDYDMAKIDRPRTICPLVEIPPHGRLGDLDAAVEKLKKLREYHLDDSQSGVFIAAGISQCIEVLTGKDAPSIIPAEEGE